jgi:tetratricopeptide (TPR) repeat protein
LELNPNYATAHQRYGWWFLAMGRMDEALAEMRRARLSDPLSPPINSNIGAFLYFQGRYDDSLAQFQMMFERDPIFSWNHTWIGQVYLEKGDFKQAIEEFKYEKLPYEQGRWGLAVAYARTGKTGEARKILNQFYQLARERYVSPTAFILIHLALGEKEKAFEWLEKAFEARDFDLCEIKVDPRLEPLRSDPRFADLLQRIGVN